MGAVLSTMLLIGAMQNCASGYDDEDDNVINLHYKCTLKEVIDERTGIVYGYSYIDVNKGYGIAYAEDLGNEFSDLEGVWILKIDIKNDALKNYQLDKIIVNGNKVHDVKGSGYDYDEGYFTIVINTEINPTEEVTVKLRFAKANE